MMKARAAHSNNRRRPPLWSALLSLLVALSLLLSPTQMCALMEMAPSHTGADSDSHAAASAHEHSGGGRAQEANHHTGTTYRATNQATLQSVPDTHECCSDMNAPPVVATAASRLGVPDAHSAPATFALAIPPSPFDLFILTNCHGRDGPTDETLYSQLSRATLLGRAPPVSV